MSLFWSMAAMLDNCWEAGNTSDRNATLNYISLRFDSVYTTMAVISSESLAGTKNVFSTFPSYSNDRWPEITRILHITDQTNRNEIHVKSLLKLLDSNSVVVVRKCSDDNNDNINICSGISMKWPFIHWLQIELEVRSVDFCGGRKTGEPGEKPSEQGREPTTNSTDMWRRVRESNPGYSCGRQRSHHCAIRAPLG